jgi:hypothetical protein
MALTALQRSLCRLLADNRIASGESYVAGGGALNELIGAPRLSQDVDLFHDTEEALAATWDADRRVLEAGGFAIRLLRDRPSFVEAEVEKQGERCLVQWARDSAFRFFPLMRHEELGLVLHPFDLATNKLLALVGRVEVRDWVDVLEIHHRLQPIGYLAWAACGKDPGFSPLSILEHAARTARYSAAEVAGLGFSTTPPDAAVLSQSWHAALSEAREIASALPPDRAGCCVLTSPEDLCRAPVAELPALLNQGALVFHEGRIRGAFPALR